MVEKHRIIKKFSKDYKRTGNKGKGEILGMVVRVTGYNRVYASSNWKRYRLKTIRFIYWRGNKET
ncbi:hypothetical protein J7J69_02970 [candidate division WOR-3 bacterium]|nr:hypothetical protein [candidate division WOR-3 bacterium]